MTTTNEAAEMREAIVEQDWSRLRALVLPYCRPMADSDFEDALGDWLAEGTYDDLLTLTPEQIAREWDEAFED